MDWMLAQFLENQADDEELERMNQEYLEYLEEN